MKSAKEYIFKHVNRDEIKGFIENNHYSKSINGCISDYCFALYDEEVMIGAMFYGKMAMAGQYKKFSSNESEVIELRRLCCIDNTVKNTESFFIAKSLKWLKKNTNYKIVVSYSDLEYGHKGIIYKASNFKFSHESKGAKVILYNGKKYHDKTIRTKYKGKLKPFAKKIYDALLSGEAVYHKTLNKLCFTYRL